MYSPYSIQFVGTNTMQTIATDRPLNISKMSGKLIDIPALNTNTVTNEFCIKMKETDTICGQCYSHRMLNTYRKRCQPAWQHNSEKLSAELLTPREVPFINSAYFRFHGHGELINKTHYINLLIIAENNPGTNFALWTKRRKIVEDVHDSGISKPSNIILVYSNPTIDDIRDTTPIYFDKVFNNVSVPHDLENCTGQKCRDCLKCYNHGGTNVIIERVK